MYYHSASNTYIADSGQGFKIGSVQYPGNWIENASPAQRTALGLSAVTVVGASGDPDFYDNAEVTAAGVTTITATLKPLATIRAAYKAKLETLCGEKRVNKITVTGSHAADERARVVAAAKAYVAAAYTGTVPAPVQHYATNKSVTAIAAADAIVAADTVYTSALDAIYNIRLIGENAINAATSAGQFTSAINTAVASLAAL